MKKIDDYKSLANHMSKTQALPTRSAVHEEESKLTFSELLNIILEAREAIISHVKNAIGDNPVDKIIFLIGNTGSGKSTALCFLRGDEMVMDGFNYHSKSDIKKIIGHEAAKSQTFLPNVEKVNNTCLVDFSGFSDTNGYVVSLGADLALKALIFAYPSQVMVFFSITATDGRYGSCRILNNTLSRLFVNKENCIVALTKYSRNPCYNQIKNIEKELADLPIAKNFTDVKASIEHDHADFLSILPPERKPF